jgi:hypothetical protein
MASVDTVDATRRVAEYDTVGQKPPSFVRGSARDHADELTARDVYGDAGDQSGLSVTENIGAARQNAMTKHQHNLIILHEYRARRPRRCAVSPSLCLCN